jgi:hypothetical protein
MRAHYLARWSKSTRSNLRQISSRIAVAVREDTTFLAREPMFRTRADSAAHAAGLRGVRRIDVEYRRHGEHRDVLCFHAVGACVHMHRGVGAKGYLHPRTSIGAMRPQTARNRRDGIAGQLRADTRIRLANRIVRQVMEAYTIGTTLIEGDTGDRIARRRKGELQRSQCVGLNARGKQTNRNRAFHVHNATLQACHRPGTLKGAALPPRHQCRGLRADIS